MTAVVILVTVIPIAVLITQGAPKFGQALSAPGAGHALAVTVESGSLALLVIFILGLPTAYYLRYIRSPAFKRFVAVVLVLALLMPPLVLGLVLAYVLAPATASGAILSQWQAASNSFPALTLAEVYEALPYFVLTAWSAISAIPKAWEEDAWALHKSPWQTFRFVLWPASRPGLVTATALAWARIVGAFGAPVVVAYHPTALPVQIWITLEEAGLPQALSLALWLVLVGLPLPGFLTWRQGTAS
ncbi:MAG: ABC transporter permease subunit [Sulfobacillus thermotolerans]|nr:ABC transporter permease subunit [Sulfobacillus thermotolerans]